MSPQPSHRVQKFYFAPSRRRTTRCSTKLIFGAADLLAIALLLRLLDKQTAVWFAWNPLVAYSFFGAAHFDSIILLAIVALIFFLERFEQTAQSRWKFALGAAVALGIAIALRPVCLVLLIPSLFALRRYSIALAAAIALPVLLRLRVSISLSAKSFRRFRSRQPAQRFILVAD